MIAGGTRYEVRHATPAQGAHRAWGVIHASPLALQLVLRRCTAITHLLCMGAPWAEHQRAAKVQRSTGWRRGQQGSLRTPSSRISECRVEDQLGCRVVLSAAQPIEQRKDASQLQGGRGCVDWLASLCHIMIMN